MKIIFIIGPHAVGKMTVGQELEKLTGFPLFHNHTTIELVHPFVSYGTPAGRKLVNGVRELFFRAFAESGGAGYILTFVWAFSEPGERAYIDHVRRIFEEKGGRAVLGRARGRDRDAAGAEPDGEPAAAQAVEA